MSLLTWNHACSVGVRAMDNQHGVLMDAMNDLRLAVIHGSGREQVCERLDHFIEFMRMHFTCEERLMEKSGFPELAAHRAKHQSIMAQILQSAHRLQYGDSVDLPTFLGLLKDGYVEHIEGVDQQYGQWFNDHGIH